MAKCRGAAFSDPWVGRMLVCYWSQVAVALTLDGHSGFEVGVLSDTEGLHLAWVEEQSLGQSEL